MIILKRTVCFLPFISLYNIAILNAFITGEDVLPDVIESTSEAILKFCDIK